jgi:inosine/xanthosine triphosphate pyrophosphatase family protein
MPNKPLSLTFVTGNAQKFDIAVKVFAEHSIHLTQFEADNDEIQSEDTERIVRDKAQKAYEAVTGPVIINDDSWSIPGLGGFPGPYMRSIAHWFTAEDFLRLTLPLEDRRAILIQWIAYQDSLGQKLFKIEYDCEILKEIRGISGTSWQKVLTAPADNGLSVAEAYDHGTDISNREVAEGWRQFIKWFKSDDFEQNRRTAQS